MTWLPSLLLTSFLVQIIWTVGAGAEERRSDVRAVLGETTEPGFWPVRGRRSGASDDYLPPPIFLLPHNRQLIPVALCAENLQQQQRYAQDPMFTVPLKDNNQVKSWMRL